MTVEKKRIGIKLWVDDGLSRIDARARSLEKKLKNLGCGQPYIDHEVKKLIKELTDDLRELRKNEARNVKRRRRTKTR